MRERVFKFGGAALGGQLGLERAVERILGAAGRAPVAVVSAIQGATDLLLELIGEAVRGEADASAFTAHHQGLADAAALTPGLLEDSERELALALRACADGEGARARDAALARGEFLAAELLAAALRLRGVRAQVGGIAELGLRVKDPGGQVLLPANPSARNFLRDAEGVLVVPGFLAVDGHGQLVTLGRQGSDLTAVWLAAAVGAAEVELHKPVRGVHTADPDLVPAATRIPTLSWDAAVELARCGASVLHRGAAELAAQEKVELHLLAAGQAELQGTRVGSHADTEGPEMLALAPSEQADAVELCVIGRGLKERAGFLNALESALRERSIAPRLSRRTPGRESLGLTLSRKEGIRALRAAHEVLFEH